jgi:dTDP-4-dehydrorhamnose 3,5-epimerase
LIFQETKLQGAFIIELEKHADQRGFFSRTWCNREAETHGLVAHMVQANMSFNHHKGTLRGMHYQASPHQEVKLVRCVRGAIFDVIVDLRQNSNTYKHWLGVVLNQDSDLMLYVPAGFAHGFQTLVDCTEINYLVSEFYTPAAERGLRWNDPAFAIEWPDVGERTISNKDRSWPDFSSP